MLLSLLAYESVGLSSFLRATKIKVTNVKIFSNKMDFADSKKLFRYFIESSHHKICEFKVDVLFNCFNFLFTKS